MEAITVVQSGSRFIARATYEQRAIPKGAGFRWDPAARCWYTTDPAIAARLNDPDAAEKAAAERAAREQAKAASIAASRASDSDAEIPCPEGLSYLPYQRAGIAFAMARPNVLFGDQMGLGKTIQAIGVINADQTIKRVLVICPASLRLNWQRELAKWLTREMSIVIANGPSCPTDGFDVVICNYDIADKHKSALQGIEWDLLICDEAHYMKSPDAKRTRAILGSEGTRKREAEPSIRARRKLFLTGTPIPNRPIEGWPIFSALGAFSNFFGFAKRYCNAQQNGYGWDFSGSSNLPELQDKLRATIMVRRLKEDVLTELPAKRRAIIELPANGAASAIAAETAEYERQEEALDALRVAVELAKASDDPAVYDDAVAALRRAASVAFAEMSKVRHATAVAKVPYVVDHLRNLIENGEKVVVFAWHKDVIAAILAEFPGAVSITGDTPMQARQDAVDRFQTDPTCLLFAGNIQAAGVGITLTASAHVVFAELDWVPGNVSQAEDRTHRIGQRNSVLIEHLVLEGSIDARMAKTLVAKQRVIDEALDREHEPMASEPALPAARSEQAEPATKSLTRAKIDEAAATMLPARIEAIHECLRFLAGMDADYAREQNGIGFSRYDVEIGHSLAACGFLTPRQAVLGAKLVNKYRRQLSTLPAYATAVAA